MWVSWIKLDIQDYELTEEKDDNASRFHNELNDKKEQHIADKKTVYLYSDRIEAPERIHHIHGIEVGRNEDRAYISKLGRYHW